MTSVEACALLEKKLEEQENRDDITALAEALEFMPLAMVQAASYIFRRKPRCSVRHYLNRFQRSDREKSSLLDFEAGQLRRDSDAKNSIIITWQISFEHIKDISPSAADLLSLMSFFDRQGIPESLLRKRNEHVDHHNNTEGHSRAINHSTTNNDESSSDDDRFENDILILRDYSFISVSVDGGSFGMHRLVQLAMRKWLEAYGQQQKWRHESISRLHAKFPIGVYENWTKCQLLFPHVKLAAAQNLTDQEPLSKWAQLLHRATWHARLMGNWADMENLAFKSLEVNQMLLGIDHPNILTTIADLAAIYLDQGRWDEAEELDVQVLEACKKKLGADHPITLTTMVSLAMMYWKHGRLDKAEELFVQVLEVCKKKLGADHPITLKTTVSLADTLKMKGRDAKALQLLRECVHLQQRVLAENHPLLKANLDTLTQ